MKTGNSLALKRFSRRIETCLLPFGGKVGSHDAVPEGSGGFRNLNHRIARNAALAGKAQTRCPFFFGKLTADPALKFP